MDLASWLSNPPLLPSPGAVQKLPELRFATCNTRLDCAHRDFQHLGDFFVGEVFEVVKHKRCAVVFVNKVQAIEHRFDVCSANVTDVVGLLECILEGFLGKSLLAPALLQKLTVECG